MTSRFNQNDTIALWIRSRLSKVHPEPAPELAVRPHDWTFAGESVREWLLDSEPVRCQRIESEVQQWAKGVGLYGPGGEHVMTEGPCTILASAVLPEGPDELVRLLSMYWTLIIAFDDQVVEADVPLGSYVHEVSDILLRGVLPVQPNAFHLAFADIRERLINIGGPAVLHTFTSHVTDALRTYIREWGSRKENKPLSPADYLRDAVANSHILPGILLQRLGSGTPAPESPLPIDLAYLARLVTMIARLENDLLSYRKDELDGAPNICWILAHEHGITPAQAVTSALSMIDALRVQHDDLLTSILSDPGRVVDHRQATAISNWRDACYAWFLTVPRYGVERGN